MIQTAFSNVLAKKWPKNWSELPKKYLRTKQMPFLGCFFVVRTSFLVQNIFIGCSDQKRCSDHKNAFLAVFFCGPNIFRFFFFLNGQKIPKKLVRTSQKTSSDQKKMPFWVIFVGPNIFFGPNIL